MARALLGLLLLALLSSCTNTKSQRFTGPKVLSIYPSSDSLPSNLLRFYVHFSRSMKTQENLEHIKLYRENGLEVTHALFNNTQELWDRDQKRLTVLFDPSRVKTDLYANQRLGRALVEGQVYRIKIDSLQDIDGQSMPTAYEKRFYVIDKDTLHPDPKKWRKDLPLPNSQEALVLHFPDPLDHLSLLQRVVLTDSLNKPVKGEVQIIQKERAWRFNPSENWYRGRYFIYVHPALEDPSGNNLGGVFERQVGIADPKDSIPIVKLEIVLNQVQKSVP